MEKIAMWYTVMGKAIVITWNCWNAIVGTQLYYWNSTVLCDGSPPNKVFISKQWLCCSAENLIGKSRLIESCPGVIKFLFSCSLYYFKFRFAFIIPFNMWRRHFDKFNFDQKLWCFTVCDLRYMTYKYKQHMSHII